MVEQSPNTKQKQIRVGVVGCGQFMSRQHIQTIARSPRLKLQYLCARYEDEVLRIGDCYPAVSYSTRWEDVVADPDVDIVVVGVVPELHHPIAVAALENGKPVYVEKPLAQTARQCREIATLARQRNLPVAVGFNRRFAPATDLLYKAFRDAGSPISVAYRISDDDRVRPPAQNWKLECRLLIEVVHIFDLLVYLLDSEPVSIFATEARFND
ncbi:MAG: Gfo/Idh/MocA family oxidoreductase, partial [Planctomycetota bacterium]|nr:Gfo/Idh/MocA family oxidoreductase [Planctomycetota bacterium]